MIRGFLPAFLLLSALGAGEAAAQRWRPELAPSLDAPRSEAELSGQALVRAIREQIDGRLLDVIGREERGGGPVYLVRWMMPNGEIRTLEVDARSGRILGSGGG